MNLKHAYNSLWKPLNSLSAYEQHMNLQNNKRPWSAAVFMNSFMKDNEMQAT